MALQLKIIVPDVLPSFPGIMENAAIYSVAVNCSTVLKYSFGIIQRNGQLHYSESDPWDGCKLYPLLKLFMLSGVQQCSIYIHKSVDFYSIVSRGYYPFHSKESSLVLLALAQDQPQVAYAILSGQTPEEEYHEHQELKACNGNADKIFTFLKKVALDEFYCRIHSKCCGVDQLDLDNHLAMAEVKCTAIAATTTRSVA